MLHSFQRTFVGEECLTSQNNVCVEGFWTNFGGFQRFFEESKKCKIADPRSLCLRKS